MVPSTQSFDITKSKKKSEIFQDNNIPLPLIPSHQQQ